MDCEWEPAKARANLREHGVDLADAVTALEDDLGLTIADAEGGERFVALGMDSRGRLLVTVFTERGNRVRLNSSRRATRAERRAYES